MSTRTHYRSWLCLLVMQIVTCTSAFRSVEEYYFNIGVEDKLIDMRLIPNGEEVNVYLFKDEPQSYFYPLDMNHSPVSITITPCSSSIEWKIYYHSSSATRRVSGLEGDPLHLQESDYKNNDHFGFSYLYSYQGREMSTYKTNNEHLSKGTFRIVLVAKEDNSNIKIFLSNEENQVIPQLPTNSNVDVVANDNNLVTIAWKQSPSIVDKGFRIKYCVAFNPKYNYQTMCALKEALEGPKPPPWPKNSGFGFSWETSWKQKIANLRSGFAKITKTRRDIHFECVGGRQWATVNSLLPGRQYYVNVFAINEYTNMSVAYTGTAFTSSTSKESIQPVLRPGAVYNFRLNSHQFSDVMYQSYAFQLKSTVTKSVAIFVQGCQPQTTAEVIYEGAVVIKDVPMENVQKIFIKQADVGNYTLRFKINQLDQSLNQFVKVCYMYHSEKCPFNAAPSSYRLSVHVRNSSSNFDCRASIVALQWSSAANFNAKYCLYVVKVADKDKDDYDEDYAEERRKCAQMTLALSPNDRVFCRQYKRHSPQRYGKLIKETVNFAFDNRTAYRFHLQVMLRRNVTVNYEPTEKLIQNNCH
ncbi:hypothetical protein CHUAL_007201 [Chamberlinius hualienensis]